MARILSQRYTLSVGATRMVRINCTDDLDDGASLTGTPTVAEQTTSDLTLDDKAVNAATYSCAVTGKTVAIGKAIEFTVAGGSAGTDYTVRCTCSTDSSPAETLVYDVILSWT
jgi:hypothetical protein